MTRMEKCKALRAETAVHYNCCQAVLVPFAAEMGVTEEQAYKMGAHFGSGMRHGSTCGAITGALMVLGMLGYDEQAATALLRNDLVACIASDAHRLHGRSSFLMDVYDHLYVQYSKAYANCLMYTNPLRIFRDEML